MNLHKMLKTSKTLNTLAIIKAKSDKFKDITVSNQQVAKLNMLYFLIYSDLRDLTWRIIHQGWLRESPLFWKFMVFKSMKAINVFNLNTKKLFINHLNDILDPNWVSGFVDAEGCFSLIIEISKTKKVNLSFEINLHEKDIDILDKIKYFFGIGTVYHRPIKKIAVYRVTNINYIKNYIIPHFFNYPLISKKWADFLLWTKVVEIIFNKDHLTEQGFFKILSYYASINRGISKKVLEHYPDILPVYRPVINLPKNLNPNWVSGFVAGDGGFSIYVRPAIDHVLSEKVYCRFHVAQHSKDQELIKLFIKFFDCGTVNVRYIPRCDYIVQDINCLYKLIIPHFDTYPLLTIKHKDYLCFKECIKLIALKQHLTIEGLNKIKSLNLEMNNNRIN